MADPDKSFPDKSFPDKSFSSRRPATNNLPNFTLPPPDMPRVASDGDGLSPSPGVNTGSSQSSHASHAGGSLYYQSASGSWPLPGATAHSSYTYSSPATATPGSGSLAQPPYHRPLYGLPSPSLPQFSNRAPSSPANGNGMHHPPTYQEQAPFPNAISNGVGGGGGVNGSGGPGHGVATTQPPTPGQTIPGGPPTVQEPGHYRHPTTQSSYPTTQSSYYPASSTPQQGYPTSSTPQQGYPASSTPQQGYPASSTPQQGSFPSYAGPGSQPSPTGPAPTAAATAGMSRGLASIPTLSGAASGGMAPPSQYGGRHAMPPISYPHYASPIQGPVLSNMHQPGGQLTMVGGGIPAMSQYGSLSHHGHMYVPHGHAPSQQDRPFKCDQCPQSFNRNHDLKRHKRIHLSVKPYPCCNCDKSFSRKDALKRHRLVKGCDKDKEASQRTTPNGREVNGRSPSASDAMSDETDEGPKVVKKE